MRFDVITLFPDMIRDASAHGVTGRALERGQVQLHCWNPRDQVHDVHRTVDDRPFGGGPGMVMLAQPLQQTIEQIRCEQADAPLVYLSPQGRPLTQARLQQAQQQWQGMILLCGRYEGVDERLIEREVDEEWSLGDYVLSGGEIAALVVIDALTRLMPGVLGDERSAQQDSFMEGLLDCPHYTRPEDWQGQRIPEVLLSGHHEHIRRWRLKQALGRTWQRRPDLLQDRVLTAEERQLLDEFISEVTSNGTGS